MSTANMHVSHTNTTYGSTATISCQAGYILNGSNTSSCDSSGRWNSTGQTCVVIGEFCSKLFQYPLLSQVTIQVPGRMYPV
ncbi:hypothetical protein DPMN_103490 [Dreissena polymorpha]|uniref:Sushi domain-containing protein n=1 Tax=Dreissena polymorpha TaxID=45954 RepID=A0A9D4HB87_DREPO|nr:hypothetical protein DPMN_103490 [Dreissena polymorpha]